MKKQIQSLVLTAALFSCGSFVANSSFAGLTNLITTLAENWVSESLSPLSQENQLVCLNVLINDSADVQSSITRAIEANSDLVNAIEAFQKNWEVVITKYITTMEQKLEQSKTAPTEEFYQKLQVKIFELFTYFTDLHYAQLYSHLANDNAELMFMFDEQGIIPAEKRSRSLPNPAL